jgi:sec-independent protein translocase protein TatA
MCMFGLGFPELVIIMVIVLLVFGAGKLPEVGGAIGKSIRGFKKATREADEKEVAPPKDEDKDKGKEQNP